MIQRYFLIEPKYSDPDTFCSFTVGSDRVRASIQIYANISMLLEVASALKAKSLREEWPTVQDQFTTTDDDVFDFQLTVMPHEGARRILRFNILQDYLDDGAPFRANISFELSPDEAATFAEELSKWCSTPAYAFVWKGN